MLCQTARTLEDMIDNKNDDDSVNLFCSSSCVMAHKVQTVSASGTRYQALWRSFESCSFGLVFRFI